MVVLVLAAAASTEIRFPDASKSWGRICSGGCAARNSFAGARMPAKEGTCWSRKVRQARAIRPDFGAGVVRSSRQGISELPALGPHPSRRGPKCPGVHGRNLHGRHVTPVTRCSPRGRKASSHHGGRSQFFRPTSGVAPWQPSNGSLNSRPGRQGRGGSRLPSRSAKVQVVAVARSHPCGTSEDPLLGRLVHSRFRVVT